MSKNSYLSSLCRGTSSVLPVENSLHNLSFTHAINNVLPNSSSTKFHEVMNLSRGQSWGKAPPPPSRRSCTRGLAKPSHARSYARMVSKEDVEELRNEVAILTKIRGHAHVVNLKECFEGKAPDLLGLLTSSLSLDKSHEPPIAIQTSRVSTWFSTTARGVSSLTTLLRRGTSPRKRPPRYWCSSQLSGFRFKT